MEIGQHTMLSGETPSPMHALMARLAHGDHSRLSEAVQTIAARLHEIVAIIRPSPDEFRALLDFLTEVGHHTDARRHEWLLLADMLGLSSAVGDINSRQTPGATPSAAPGPFYRPDVPPVMQGGSLSRDGKGEPLSVSGRVVSLDGAAIAAARIEVWHANADGLHENQDPDLQPEFNLRGWLRSDMQGRFRFRTIKPGGYRIPAGGPVAALAARLGLSLERPAHISFRVTAEGYQTLTTHIFDRADPAIGRDAIFGVKPEMLADFGPAPPVDGGPAHRIDINLVLCPEDGRAQIQAERRQHQ